MLSLLSYVTYQAFRSKPAPKDSCVNLKIQKESSKVVNMVEIEELGDKVSYCRCWRSKKVGRKQNKTKTDTSIVITYIIQPYHTIYPIIFGRFMNFSYNVSLILNLLNFLNGIILVGLHGDIMQAGLVLYCWQRQITFGSWRIRVNMKRRYKDPS